MQPIFDRLLNYLYMPSISAQGIGMGEVAEYLVKWLGKLGLDTTLRSTAGRPMVLARRFDHPFAPVVLLYGHYEVQAPDAAG